MVRRTYIFHARAVQIFTVISMIYINEMHCQNASDVRITCNTSYVDLQIPTGILHNPRYTYVIAYNATVCNVPVCPTNCSLILGNSLFITSCTNGKEFSSEITFPEDTSTTYLGNLSLVAINRFAFNGIANDWKELWLNNNSLTDLHSEVFVGLSNLERLRLFQNKLTELRRETFIELPSLLLLDIRLNGLKSLQLGAFQGLIKLSELAMDYNKYVDLKSGIFDELESVQEIDLDHGVLEKVEVNVFRKLDQIRELDLDHNKIMELQPGVFNGLSSLEELELDGNKLTHIPIRLFARMQSLQTLILSHNLLVKLNSNVLYGLNNLKELYLSHNHLIYLHSSLFQDVPDLTVLFLDYNYLEEINSNIFRNLTNLKILSLAQTNLVSLPSVIFEDLHALQILNISRNFFTHISTELFHHLTQLAILDLKQNPLDWVNSKSFEKLTKPTIVYVDEYATCCFIESANCSSESPPSPFISCKRLIPYSILRIFVWIVCIATIVGNTFVSFTRCRQKTKNKVYVQDLFIKNLSLSDLLMGVYLLILLSVDLNFNDYFPSRSESWRHSILCKIAGGLSILSSEASVFFITLVSIDRFVCVKYPYSATRLRAASAKLVVISIWSVAFLISVTSILIPLFSPELYDVSEICVGLPISRINMYESSVKSFDRQERFGITEAGFESRHVVETKFTESEPSMFFSIAVFAGLNLICFLTVAFCYTSVFVTATRSSRRSGLTKEMDREIRMAFKMAGIVLTDFICWVVLAVLSILVQTKTVTISPEAYAWIATFILPINSCMNPFLYTLYSLISDYRQRKENGIEISQVSSNT